MTNILNLTNVTLAEVSLFHSSPNGNGVSIPIMSLVSSNLGPLPTPTPLVSLPPITAPTAKDSLLSNLEATRSFLHLPSSVSVPILSKDILTDVLSLSSVLSTPPNLSKGTHKEVPPPFLSSTLSAPPTLNHDTQGDVLTALSVSSPSFPPILSETRRDHPIPPSSLSNLPTITILSLGRSSNAPSSSIPGPPNALPVETTPRQSLQSMPLPVSPSSGHQTPVPDGTRHITSAPTSILPSLTSEITILVAPTNPTSADVDATSSTAPTLDPSTVPLPPGIPESFPIQGQPRFGVDDLNGLTFITICFTKALHWTYIANGTDSRWKIGNLTTAHIVDDLGIDTILVQPYDLQAWKPKSYHSPNDAEELLTVYTAYLQHEHVARLSQQIANPSSNFYTSPTRSHPDLRTFINTTFPIRALADPASHKPVSSCLRSKVFGPILAVAGVVVLATFIAIPIYIRAMRKKKRLSSYQRMSL